MNKTITSKISVLLLLTLFAFQVQGQALWTTNGTYKISTSGLTPELYMTINTTSGNLEWAAELANNDPTQVWTITDHRTPASAGLMEITANIPSVGSFTMAVADISGHPSLTLVARAGDPVSVTELAGDYSGLDQFQRRKTSSSVAGNDALFLRNPSGTNSRYGVVPSAAGDAVQFDGGGIDALQFHLIAALSTEDFDTSSVFISNPVNNELNIEGLTANVKQVSVYSLLGKQVLSKNVNQQATLSFDVSALSSGMYLVKMQGDKGSFVHKIVKQ